MEEPQQMNTADGAIVENMRSSNYEQFKSLVRMHLSFELDLNTDEFDLPCHDVVYYEKGKVKKWSRLSKKIKGCTAASKTTSPTEPSCMSLTMDLINQLRVLKDFLLKQDNVVQEGIFRRTGAVTRQNELRLRMNQRKDLNLTEGYTVHDCATVYKGCLADLPEPLLTDAHYPAHCQIADLCNADDKTSSTAKEDHLLHSVQLLLLLLPLENRILLQDVIDMLHETVKYQSSNKMSPDSLATLFAPHLICPRNLPAEALHYVSQNMSSVISYMIAQGSRIFELPPKLATDIRAYSLEQKRKKTMSPEQILDESISDISTVNTVYTFVDRERTAEAHNSNPTDTALAQLYAHIQSLPESSKKRKLIKQFNKENGQGTPLQFLMLNRVKNAGSGRSAKSIGDSIKKHIFNRGIMPRTPKRTLSTTPCNTPNSAITAPKARVLFQSPALQSSLFGSNLLAKRHPLHKSISSSSLLSTNLISNAPSEATLASTAMDSKWESSEPIKRDCIAKSDSFKKYFPGKDEDAKPESTFLNPRLCMDYNLMKRSNLSKTAGLFRCKSDTDIICYGVENTRGSSTTPQGLWGLRKSASSGNLDSCSSDQSLEVRFKRSMSSESGMLVSIKKCIPLKERINALLLPESEAANTPKGLNIYRNKDIMTSTPSLFCGRRSMSPITKSTQRMPKSMQESIMTPRSRKPVMLATSVGLLDQNQPVYQGDLSSFREQDEDSFLSHNTSSQTDRNNLYPSFSETHLHIKESEKASSNSLTNTFREYLFSRSVLTTSPVDTSFSSHSDDFGSTPDIRDLNESEMSASLLYCLDGNRPESSLSGISRNDDELESNPKLIAGTDLQNGLTRKRSASIDDDFEGKENAHPNELKGQTRKVFIIESNPNETSL